MEIWKDIKGYEGYYQVSNLGSIKRLRTIVKTRGGAYRSDPCKILKPEYTYDGYLRIALMREHKKQRFQIHRLVADAFIPNPENKEQVNHINGNKADNRAENLEWCSSSENMRHSFDILGHTMKGKTYPKHIICLNNGKMFYSMHEVVNFIGGTANISGLTKSLDKNRCYHGYWFKRISDLLTKHS